MTKLLVLGYTLPAYIPPENTVAPKAFNLRTAQLVAGLLGDGHEVTLCCKAHQGEILPQGLYPLRNGNLTCIIGGGNSREWVKCARKAYSNFQPDAVVGISFRSACVATLKLPSRVPLWMDIYGDPITDNQLALCTRGSNRGALSALWLEEQVLRRGDVFSVCSNPQRYALIGKLGRVGRLESRTCGYEFVHTIFPAYASGAEAGDTLLANEFARPLQDDKFIVLSYGRCDAWVDVDTLFAGLEYAMSRDERIRYVSLEEGVADPARYARFVQMVNASPFRERFQLLGWQPYEVVHQYCIQSHLGILVLRDIYETALGAPTRVVEMLAMGLPVLIVGCELSEWLAQREAALTCPFGDAVAVGEAILRCARDPDLWNRLSQRGRQVVNEELSPERTAQPLREWAALPRFAPDRQRDVREMVENRVRLAMRRFLWRFFDNFR